MDSYYMSEGPGYADDTDQVGIVGAVEATTGSKNSMFKGFGRNVSVPTYQWLIVAGAVIVLWGLGYGLRSDIRVG